MASPARNFYIWLTLNLKNRADGTSKTVLLSNRPFLDVATSDTDLEHWPIITGASGLGTAMGNYTPRKLRGVISCDISESSFGTERRLIDLFERFTANEQDITVYIGNADLGGITNPSASGTAALVSKCVGFRVDFQNKELQLNIESDTLPRRILTKVLNSDDFANIPENSKGKALPIVFGPSVEVKGYPVNTDAENAQFAYATTLGSEHAVGGVQAYKAKNYQGDFVEVSSAATTTTVLYGFTHQSGKTNDVWPSDAVKIGYRFTPSTGYIVTAAQWSTYHGASASDGGLRFSLFRGDGTQRPTPVDPPGTELAFFQVDASSLTTSAVNTVQGYFNVPVVVEPSGSYWFVISFLTGTAFNVFPYFDSAIAYTYYYEDGNNGIWTAATGTTAKQQYWELYGTTFADTTSTAADNQGLGYAYVQTDQRTDFTGFDIPNLSALDLNFEIDGLEDDSSGTFTGTSNEVINETHQALALLSQDFVSGAWSSPSISNSEYSAHHVAIYGTQTIQLSGRTEGRQSAARIIEEICRATAARVGLRAGGLEVYSYGKKQTPKGRITGADARIISLEERPAEESILNTIEFFYDRRINTADIPSVSAEGGYRAYAQRLAKSDADGDEWSKLIGQSESIYGQRFLGDQTFNWFQESRGAELVAEILLSNYARNPIWICTFEVDYLKFSTLDIFDVWTLTHPDLPAYYGTSSDATPESYSGAYASKGGEEEFRAAPYRAFIEERRIEFRTGETPTLRVTARLALDDKELI